MYRYAMSIAVFALLPAVEAFGQDQERIVSQPECDYGFCLVAAKSTLDARRNFCNTAYNLELLDEQALEQCNDQATELFANDALICSDQVESTVD